MNSIIHNPFRILNSSIAADQKNINRNYSDLQMCIKFDDINQIDDSWKGILPRIEYSETLINDAHHKISNDNDRLFHSLFWFQINNQTDSAFFEAVKQNNFSHGLALLQNETAKPLTDTNFSSYKNFALLSLISLSGQATSKTNVLRGISVAFESIYFFTENQNHTFLPGTEYITDLTTVRVRFAKEIAMILKPFVGEGKRFKLSEIIGAIPELPKIEIVIDVITKEYSTIPLEMLKKKIEEADQALEQDEANDFENGYKIGAGLLDSVLHLYQSSAALMLETEYALISDMLASTLNFCAVKHYNKNYKKKNGAVVTKNTISLSEKALSICMDASTRETITANLEVYRSNKLKLQVDAITTKLPDNIYVLSNAEIDAIPGKILGLLIEYDALMVKLKSREITFDEISIDLNDELVFTVFNFIIDYINHTGKNKEMLQVLNKLCTYPMSESVASFYNKNIKVYNENMQKATDNSGCAGVLVIMIVSTGLAFFALMQTVM
ncbi:hypothetical protein [Flavobacterium sp.]|uniref:hypothetical protein n=1 Tax=Flavobacterium sp. TaxID=239 RepID=UPI002628583A|nr:hypothetical protein [Flavobacterium sp.]